MTVCITASNTAARLVSTVIVFIVVATGAAGAQSPFTGAWVGELSALDEPLAMRLDIVERDGAPAAELDFPQFVYADQPANARYENDALVVDLPFGFGKRALRREGERLAYSSAPNAELQVTINLHRVAPFRPVQEPVIFGADGARVNGRLVIPELAEPAPLIIVLARSGDLTMADWSYSSWADHFARLGLAKLIYDRPADTKRKPDGTYYSIEDHSRDVRAALDMLTNDPRIDSSRIGLLGASRGAWIALDVAKSDQRIAFLTARGAAAVGVEAQEYMSVEYRMRGEGFDDKAIAAALAYMRIYFQCVKSPESWPTLERAAQEAAQQDWSDFVQIPRTVDDLDWYRANINFDPMQNSSDLSVPVFYAWGGGDRLTPPSANRPLFEAMLGDRVDAQYRVYPGANHLLEGPMNTDDDDDIVWTGMTPQYLLDLDGWLRRQGVVASE